MSAPTPARVRTLSALAAAATAAVPAAALAASLALAAPAQATTTPAPGGPASTATTGTTGAPGSTGPKAPADQEQARRVEAALREVVDLELLQPTCGQRGTLTAAAVQALRTVGVEVKASGLPTIDLGPLGWVGIGTQHPGRAVALELHLLPTGPVPVNLTIGEKACPARPGSPAPRTPVAPATETATAAPVPASTSPSAGTPSATARPSEQPELARTGGDSPTWPYLVSGAGLLAAGAVTAVVAARRRTG